MRARPKISLKMQAVNFLSRREHSRQELRTKLLASLRRSARAEAVDASAFDASAAETEVDELLDWLIAHQYLSEARFVETRLHARAARQGASMIRHELARHGLSLDPEQAALLRETEFARANQLWERKFGETATDARSRARQARFLISRGFGSDVVRRIVGGLEQGD